MASYDVLSMNQSESKKESLKSIRRQTFTAFYIKITEYSSTILYLQQALKIVNLVINIENFF